MLNYTLFPSLFLYTNTEIIPPTIANKRITPIKISPVLGLEVL